MSRFALVAVAVLAVASGCGTTTDPNVETLHDVEAATRALDRAIGIQTAFITAGNINTGATTSIIANAILNRIQSEAAGCVTASATDNTLHADFGTGCALATASMHIGGTIDLSVDPDAAIPGGITVTHTLAVTVDNSFALSGDIVVSTPDGTVFSYASDGLTLDGVTVAAPLITGGIAAGGATLDADNATAAGKPLIIVAMHQRFAACYPDDGSAALDTLEVDFASDTPETGHVMLSTGATASLPSRAGCPQQ